MSKIISLLEPSDKIILSVLVCISIINGVFQTFGLISIMPFIALISDPSISDSHEYIIFIKNYLNIESHQEMLMYFGGFSLLSLVISNTVIILNYWLSLWFFNQFGLKISTQLLKRYLNNPPHAFYQHSISKLSKRIFSDVDRAIIGSLLAYTSIFTDIFVLCIISALLLYINPMITLLTITALISSYILVYLVLAKKIDTLGKGFTHDEESIYSIIKQSLTFYKEIKISSKQDYFLNRYVRSAKNLYKGSTQFYTLKFIPIQIIELLIFSIILLMAGYLSINTENTAITITTISVYAISAYRLVPIIKNIFDSTEEILHAKSIIKPLLEEIASDTGNTNAAQETITFNHKIDLRNITFTYQDNKTATLNDLNLSFQHSGLTCIIGKSGIGKSTLLDIIMGVFPATSGNILIDSTYLTKTNLTSWQSQIGYVPQKIQLLESSVKSNIAFAEFEQDIDMKRVQKAAKIACINELIEDQLKDGYDTIIGDGGKTLSGGEVQRIGIARALYKNPKLIILDEATNALDNDTERKIITFLKSKMDLTTIFVSHKQSVVDQASSIINLSNIQIKKAS